MPSNPSSRKLRTQTIRFSREVSELIHQAASAQGVPFAQYVREAALMRVLWDVRGAATDSEVEQVREAFEILRTIRTRQSPSSN